jgi:hypothetical protein
VIRASLFTATVLLLCGAGQARAGFIMTFVQDGATGDVVATGTGTLNLTALTGTEVTGSLSGLVDPMDAAVLLGPPGLADTDDYTSISVPPSLGTGGITNATSGSGPIVGVLIGEIRVPHGYVSGTQLDDSSTWDNSTFASLGLTPGTYIYTWGSAANGTADSVTVQIGPAAAPEPASLTLLGLGVAGIAGYAWRRRR